MASFAEADAARAVASSTGDQTGMPFTTAAPQSLGPGAADDYTGPSDMQPAVVTQLEHSAIASPTASEMQQWNLI